MKPDKGLKKAKPAKRGRGVLPLLVLITAFLGACSTAPKRPVEVFTIQKQTETQLNLANHEADRGNYQNALDLLEEAQRLAVSTDRPPLLIRVWLSRGNVLLSLGRVEDAQVLWETALAEAERAGHRGLIAACRIYQARALLLLAGPRGPDQAEEVKFRVNGELGFLKGDPLNTALGWTVIGMAEQSLGRWTEAERALERALDIHDKERYLELAAYDWYRIASVRSLSGQYEPALEALAQAMVFDRRAENSHGLGMDWRALGDVYAKAGRPEEAAAAYRRSADIFRAIGLEKNAEEAEGRIGH
jgi:tetratricopeptide (TPR) repeat protein